MSFSPTHLIRHFAYFWLLGACCFLIGCAPSPEATDADDTYPFTTNGEILRWNGSETIRILLPVDEDVTDVTDYDPAFRTAFVAGIEAWSSSLSVLGIQIEYVTSGEYELQVNWVDGSSVETGILGFASFNASATPSRALTITTQNNLNDNQKHGTEGIKKIVMHQLGHVLGLRHSFAEEDIMYPYLLEQTAVSGRDNSTLQKLYSFIADVNFSNFPTNETVTEQDRHLSSVQESFMMKVSCGFGNGDISKDYTQYLIENKQ